MTMPPSRLRDRELARLLITTGRNVGSPAPGAMQRTLQRIEVAASAGLLATGGSLAVAKAASHGVVPLACGTAGATETTTLIAGGLSAAKTTATSLVAKWFASGLMVGLVAGGGTVGVAVVGHGYLRTTERPSVALARPGASISQGVAEAKRPSSVEAPVGVEAADRTAQEAPVDEPQGVQGQPTVTGFSAKIAGKRAAVPPNLNPASTLSPELARELSLLDLARSALERGDRQRAQYWLGQHQRQFPEGQLGPEAAVLRVQTESQSMEGQPSQGDNRE